MENISEITSDSVIYCPSCGAKGKVSDTFCKSCGYKLQDVRSENSRDYGYQAQRVINESQEDAEARFVDLNYEFYSKKFAKLRASGDSASWNWAAFFFGPLWCIYRKMFALGFGVLLAESFLDLYNINTSSPGIAIIILAERIVLGISSNNLYMRHIGTVISDEKQLDASEQQIYFKRKRGVTIGFVIVACLLNGFILSLSLH